MNPDDQSNAFDGAGEAARQLTDEQFEAELTIAAANPGLTERYVALLAELERRRRG